MDKIARLLDTPSINRVTGALALLAAILLLFPAPALPGLAAYPPLHTAMESLTVVVAMLVFATGINSHQRKTSLNLMLLSCAFLAVGLFDFGHNLSFPGMPDFITPSGAEKAYHFWLAARLTVAVALLAAALLPWRQGVDNPVKAVCLALTLAFVAAVYWLILFQPDNLPRVFATETGFLPLERGFEYLIVGLHAATAVFFYRQRSTPRPYDTRLLFAAACVMGLGELVFAAHGNANGLLNLFGHLYKIIAYFLIYRAIFVYAIHQPHHELQKAEERLERVLEGSADGFWDCDLRSGVVEYSGRWAEILGYRPDEIDPHSDSWKNRIHPDDRDRVLKAENDYVEGRAPAYDTEFRMQTKSGEWRHIRSRGKITGRDANGRALRISGAHTDVTEHWRTEKKIARLVHHNALILDAAGKGICGMDKEGRVTFINRMAAKLLGYTTEEATGRSLHDLSHYRKADGSPYPAEECPIQAAARNGTCYYERDELFWCRDGTPLPVEYTSTPILEGDVATGAVLVFSDISERKRAEQTLRHWQQFVEHATWGMVIGDVESRTVKLTNPAFARLHGYEIDELPGTQVAEFYAPESRAEIPRLHEALIRTGRLNFECSRLRKDGTTFPALVDIAILYDAHGAPESYIANVQDITEHKQAEKLLIESERKFRILFGSIRDAVFVHYMTPDAPGRFIEVNDVACSRLGYTREELLTMTPLDLDAPDTGINIGPVVEKVARGESAIFEQIHVTKEGRRIPVEVSLTPTLLDGQNAVLSLVRDITERVRIERQIVESHARLRELSAHLQTVREEEKSRIAREIHDDLGGTLTALKIDVYWLARALPMEMTPFLERTESMSHLLDTAVDATRRIITELRPSILDDLGLLPTLEWQCAQFHKRTGIECRVECGENHNNLDKERAITLFRIFQEALTNVARHSGASRVEVTYSHDEQGARLCVRDDGCGLPADFAIDAASYGLRGMAERANSLDGQFSVTNADTGGLALEVRLPTRATEGGGGKKNMTRGRHDTHFDRR